MHRMRMVLLLVAWLPCGCAAPACRLDLATTVDFITPPDDPRVLLPVNVDRRDARLLLDTGADSTVLTDAAFERVAGLERADHQQTIFGIGGVRLVAGTQMWRFSLGVLASELSVVVLDHSILPPIPPTDGLLGMNAMEGYDIDLDMVGGRLGLYHAEGDCGAPERLLPGRTHRLAVLPSPGGPPQMRFHVTIHGQVLVAQIDTGAPRTVVFAGAARRLGLIGSGTVAAPPMQGVGGFAQGGAATIDLIQVGPYDLRDMPATVLDQDTMSQVDLLLGMDFVRLLHVWLSPSSGSIVLQYPPRATLAVPGT